MGVTGEMGAIKKMWIADQGDGTYRNPILYTDYADPDAVRVGDDYFLIASSFCNAPSVPVLHSKDLVNWKVVNYVMERLPFERYRTPQHGCGAWAPAIRYHEGLYYVFIPFPDEGIMMCTASDPREKWSEPHFIKQNAGWIDPCPFWDEDGKMYMVNGFAKSRIGFKSALYISPVRDEGQGLTAFPDEGGFVYDGHATQPTIEGPKLYKRNGYYYIFAPAGGVKTGWQTVLRSKKILGPYEEKIVMRQGGSSVNGPHQGAWVQTQSGEDWFLHFQDVGSAGRIVHLQPMHWVEDWPVIGVNGEESGCGEPVARYKKPDVGAVYPIDAPEDSDLFAGEKLGLQWQWNANYEDSWYRLGEGGLRLYARKQEQGEYLCNTPNLLLQKWPAPEFTVTACLHLDEMKDGDSCGMVSLGGYCDSLLVRQENGKRSLLQRTEKVGKKSIEEKRTALEAAEGDVLYIRMCLEDAARISWEVSGDGETFHAVGQATEAIAMPGAWVGVKTGLAAVHEGAGEAGNVKVESFVFRPGGCVNPEEFFAGGGECSGVVQGEEQV